MLVSLFLMEHLATSSSLKLLASTGILCDEVLVLYYLNIHEGHHKGFFSLRMGTLCFMINGDVNLVMTLFFLPIITSVIH